LTCQCASNATAIVAMNKPSIIRVRFNYGARQVSWTPLDLVGADSVTSCRISRG
jgi:hypothetical protein